FRMNLFGVLHFRADDVFDRRVTVESTPVLANLCDPRPHTLDWRVNGDHTYGTRYRLRHEFIARPDAGSFTPRCTPAHASRSKKRRVTHSADDRARQKDVGSFHD